MNLPREAIRVPQGSNCFSGGPYQFFYGNLYSFVIFQGVRTPVSPPLDPPCYSVYSSEPDFLLRIASSQNFYLFIYFNFFLLYVPVNSFSHVGMIS